MKYTYIPEGVCSTWIDMEIEEGIVKKVEFTDGCHGNLQAIAKLVEGMPVSEVKEKLSGIRCGFKGTSCADQLVKGLEEALVQASSD